jgi:hypothetical protein
MLNLTVCGLCGWSVMQSPEYIRESMARTTDDKHTTKYYFNVCVRMAIRAFLICVAILFYYPKLFAQQAIFTAKPKEIDNHQDIAQMQWSINGQLLTFGSDTVKITPNEKVLDTILFKRNEKSLWDTIICDIAQPRHYNFVYNECCGGFNVADGKTHSFIKGEVIFEKTEQTQDVYLGLLGETGVLLHRGNNTVLPMCRSAMSPNIFLIQLKEIEICADTAGCVGPDSDLQCYTTDGGQTTYDLYYRTKKTITRFLYMPLNEEPLKVIYNPVNKQIVIK